MDVYLLSNNQSFGDSLEAAGSGDLQPTSTTASVSPTATRPSSDDVGSGQMELVLPNSVVLLVPALFTVLAMCV